MPGQLTEITEITTALGTLRPNLSSALTTRPRRLRNVPDAVWTRLVDAYGEQRHRSAFETAFGNGVAFLEAEEGLRRRPPRIVEWKGPHRPPGDDVIPADVRIDHVYQISCKYLSKVVHNTGPSRLFDRLLVGEDRSPADWFGVVAPRQYQAFYEAVRMHVGGTLPREVGQLDRTSRAVLKEALRPRLLPADVQPRWLELCETVATASALRLRANLQHRRSELRLLWRLLRIGDAPYFVLGMSGARAMRLRIASAWDWLQAYELRSLDIGARQAGQAEVQWRAEILDREAQAVVHVEGHIEIRWSHGRLQGSPEAKIYLDTAHDQVPGYFLLR